MQYVRPPFKQKVPADDGITNQSQFREGREEDTYVKAPFRGKNRATSPAMLDSHTFNSESSFPARETIYNEVKADMNTSPYHSDQNVYPRSDEPDYVHFQRQPDDPGNQENLDVGGIIKQLTTKTKEKNSDSGSVINIGHITIYNNNTPDSQYYGSLPRRPPEPCLPHHYDYPEQHRDYHDNLRASTTPEEALYIGLPEKTPVEHVQSSVPHDHSPYRETRNFLLNSRSASSRTRDTQTEQQEAENDTSQESPAQVMIQHRKSSDGPPNAFDVQLTLQDSNQRWIGELKPSPTLESNQVPLPMFDLSENPYDSHTKSPDRHYPTISQVMNPVRTSPPTERLPETDNKSPKMTNHGDDRQTILFEEQTQSADEALEYTRQLVPSVENPSYMARSVIRRMNRPEKSRQNNNAIDTRCSIGMNEEDGGQNLHRGWLMSQSTPDMRHVVPTLTRHSFSKLMGRSHQCEVDGFFSVHDEKAIEEAKTLLENIGNDGNWLVTSAVRQPMQSYYLHVRLLGKTNSFPINEVKGKKIAIDTSSSTSFACLCKLIKHYTQKKTLPNQDRKLGNAFKMSSTCVTHL